MTDALLAAWWNHIMLGERLPPYLTVDVAQKCRMLPLRALDVDGWPVPMVYLVDFVTQTAHSYTGRVDPNDHSRAESVSRVFARIDYDRFTNTIYCIR